MRAVKCHTSKAPRKGSNGEGNSRVLANWNAGSEVNNEPGFEVAFGNGAIVGDDVAVVVEICRTKVDEDVKQKIYI